MLAVTTGVIVLCYLQAATMPAGGYRRRLSPAVIAGAAGWMAGARALGGSAAHATATARDLREGRGVSDKYGVRDAACPLSTRGGRGGGTRVVGEFSAVHGGQQRGCRDTLACRVPAREEGSECTEGTRRVQSVRVEGRGVST